MVEATKEEKDEREQPNMASETSSAAVGVILSVFVVAAASAGPTAAVAPPTAAPSSKYSLEEACKQTGGHHDLCVATLSADPSSKTADTAKLARLAIQAAQRNASETATYLSSFYDDDSIENKTAQLQQCLEDCDERYESAVEQLSDATSAVDAGAYSESEALVVASQAEVNLCQLGCQDVPGNPNVLTVRNHDVDRLCSIALTITKLIRGPPS